MEEHAQLVRELAPWLLGVLRELGDPERGRDRGIEQAAGLQAVDLLEVVAELLRVGVLAADHPERRLDELARYERTRIGERQPEGLGEERVACEDGGRLVELGPCARTSPPKLVVVQRGQVVMDEREVVDQLDRDGGIARRLTDLARNGLSDQQHQRGAQFFPRGRGFRQWLQVLVAPAEVVLEHRAQALGLG